MFEQAVRFSELRLRIGFEKQPSAHAVGCFFVVDVQVGTCGSFRPCLRFNEAHSTTLGVQRSFRIGVLGSGKGSNFVAIADAIAAGQIPASVAVVLSDVEDAGILGHARHRNVPVQFISPGSFRTKLDEKAEAESIHALRSAGVDLVVLAGFMRILKGGFLREFADRVVNIHPSLLPSFPGLEAWKQALEYGVKITGCTVHLVDQGIDTGPILGQASVLVLENDTSTTLHERIQMAERELYPRIIAAWFRNEIRVRGRTPLGGILKN